MARNTVFNKVSYTSKTYDTILADLINAIPTLTDKWKNYSEDDPGIVLLKMAAFTGDMLAYNMDFQVGETFPQSATQRKNAAKIYDLIGYKMHWYRSASCLAVFQITRPEAIPDEEIVTVTLPKFTSVLTPTGLPYVILGDDVYRTFVLPAGSDSATAQIRLLQGYGKEIDKIFPSTIPNNGRIYFPETNVDEDNGSNKLYPHIKLTVYNTSDNKVASSNVWYKVDNLLTQSDSGQYFEFDVDENDQPYIQLVSNFRDYLQDDSVYLNLAYVVSEGSDGGVSEDVGFRLNLSNLDVLINGVSYNVANNISIISNTQSDMGYDPETCAEAVYNGFREALTLNTAVTLADYATYAVKVDGIRACRAIDDFGAEILDPITVNGNLTKVNASTTNNYFNQIDLLNYYITPGSVKITINYKYGSPATPASVELYDKDGNGLLYSLATNTYTLYNNSYVNYTNGQLVINNASGNTWLDDDLEYIIEYTPRYAPYTVALQLVMNDYHYLPTYEQTVLTTLLDLRKVVGVQYVLELGKTLCIPFNIVIHSTEPYSTTDTSIVDYMSNQVNDVLEDYFNSNERSFGDLINYTDVTNTITNSDTKIELADIRYPLRNLQVDADKFPRLGQTAINVDGDPDLEWLQEKIFSIQDDTNYQDIRKMVLGYSHNVPVTDAKVSYIKTGSGDYTLQFVLPTDSTDTSGTDDIILADDTNAPVIIKVINSGEAITYTSHHTPGAHTGEFSGTEIGTSSIDYRTGIITLPIGENAPDTTYVLASYTYISDDVSNGTLDYHEFLDYNSSLDNITTKINMRTALELDADTGSPKVEGITNTVLLPIEWWCSRDDLIQMQGEAMGNLNNSEIIQDTPVTLFFKIIKNKASMVFTEPIDIKLIKQTELYGG